MLVSQKIVRLREEKHLSQADLAKAIGATTQAVSLWENGTNSPRVKYMKALCDAYGLDLNVFIDESTDHLGNEDAEDLTPRQKQILELVKQMSDDEADDWYRILARARKR